MEQLILLFIGMPQCNKIPVEIWSYDSWAFQFGSVRIKNMQAKLGVVDFLGMRGLFLLDF